jgi:hypothetical protein
MTGLASFLATATKSLCIGTRLARPTAPPISSGGTGQFVRNSWTNGSFSASAIHVGFSGSTLTISIRPGPINL